MRDHFHAELLRFRAWALSFGALHLLVLAFLSRLLDLAQQPMLVYQLFAAAYVLSGLLLGAYQMGSYRRPNAWVTLLHRPLAHRRLALALMSAPALLLALAILLPLLAIAGFQDSFTARVVDARHALLALSAWLLACIGYLVGAYAMA